MEIRHKLQNSSCIVLLPIGGASILRHQQQASVDFIKMVSLQGEVSTEDRRECEQL